MSADQLERVQLQLREPAYHHSPPRDYTAGGIVARVCDQAGFHPDPEQRLILDDVFAVGPHGRAAAFEVDIEAARQNLKTGSILQMILGWLFVLKVGPVVWSAHEYDSVAAPFGKLVEIIETHPFLERRVAKIISAGGKQKIEMADGNELRCKARTATGGRGLGGRRVVLDEGFALRPEHVGSLLPLMSAQKDPQVVYASSAEHEGSVIQRALAARGKSGTATSLAYLSWQDVQPRTCEREGCMHLFGTPGCCLDEESRWLAANPSLALTDEEYAAGRRITLHYVRGERESLPPEEFARERLGWGDLPADAPLMPLAAWSAVAGSHKIAAKRAIGVDVSPMRDRSAVVMVGEDGDGSATAQVLQVGAGTDWLYDCAFAWLEQLGLDTWYRTANSQAALLDEQLNEDGYPVTALPSTTYGVACGSVYERVAKGRLLHAANQLELDAAIEGARLRPNTEGVSVWSRSRSSVDISPLVAMTVALHGHLSAPDDDWIIDLNSLGDERDGESEAPQA